LNAIKCPRCWTRDNVYGTRSALSGYSHLGYVNGTLERAVEIGGGHGRVQLTGTITLNS
jgi:hypothetical protein